ncbi:VOC family protein [Flavobacterium sp. NRK F7]|uniref:VOC family protein n=1 Tax=Flavobacterium sp. NRK F7 TaxID=2954930 RepID=UPI0020907F4D|nr:VOC family protein [Flavobacterium sp. NRK F7]MCO6162557.1 VOC family protein [Flavobacterium sp. NRK F7]
MNVDHIFIFTDDNGKVADELVAFGFIEGSSRVHVGQGTTNRKFYFENFFLEILWVHSKEELNSKNTKTTGLWQRAEFKNNDFSPFGLCIVNSDETDTLFENSFVYQPDYFPVGMGIDIIKNEDQPSLPWTFRLPFKGFKKNENEPINHKNKIGILTKIVFEYLGNPENPFLDYFKNENKIEFIHSSKLWLKLIFDNGKQGKKQVFDKISLTIEY